ncbi:MAG TPA: hypothetical protein VFZ53_27845 [Polyangiaceae bacterium]
MRRTTLLAFAGCGALALAACGSSTKDDFDDENEGGEAGDGGTTTGGASGASSGGASGSSSGGASSGGASGSAGTGGMRGYRPPDRQIQGCTRMCELETAAMCPNEDSLEKCVEDCRVAIQFEVCSADWDALFACAATAGPATCNTDGEAVVADCVSESITALTCVFEDGITGDLASQCSEFCAAEAAPMCPATDPSDACNFNCQVLAGAFPVCAGVFEPFLACSADADYTCNAEGEPTAAGCAGPLGTFADCLTAEYGWVI